MGLSLGSLGRKIRDIFDANTQADQQKRIARGEARFYQDQSPQTKGIGGFTNRVAQVPNIRVRGVEQLLGRKEGRPGFNPVTLGDIGRNAPIVGEAINFAKRDNAGVSDFTKGIFSTGYKYSPPPALARTATRVIAETNPNKQIVIPAPLRGAIGSKVIKAPSRQFREDGALITALDVGSDLLEIGPVAKQLARGGRVAVKQVGKDLQPGGVLRDQAGAVGKPKPVKLQSKILTDYGVDRIKNQEEFTAAVAKVAKKERIAPRVAEARVQRMLDAAREASVKRARIPSDQPALKINGKVKKNVAVKEVLTKLSQTKTAASAEGDLTSNVIRSVAKKEGVSLDPGFVARYQSGELANDAERRVATVIKKETDRVFRQQQQISPDVKYRKDYLPQTYSNTADQVEEATRQLSKKTGSARRRVFNTYQEAGQYGLSPRYNTVDKMVGANAAEARKALGNRDVVDAGLSSGVFTVNREPGLSAIDGFTDFNGQQIYSSKKVADVINGVVQESTTGLDKALKGTHELNSIWQDIALAGGIPGTPINFFTLGQVIKDLSAGNISVGKSFLYSLSDKATARRFTQNADFVRQMASRGVPLNAKSGLTNEGKNALSAIWGSAVNQPTFARFMPNQYLSLAENSFKKLSKKMSQEEALDLSAEITKKFYGITDQIAKGRSNNTQNLISSIFFAPRYREAVLNTLINTGKSVTTQIGNPAYSMNRRLFAGMAVTAAGYELLNRQINGHSMLDNRENQELSLQIPYGAKDAKGNQPVINIPFMPGFMTIPRAVFNAGASALRGDAEGVVAEGSKTLAMPLKTGGEVLSNRDYFGRPIRVDDKVAAEEGVEPDSAGTALGKTGLYLAKQALPAWGRAGIDAAQGKPIEQVLAQGLEAPVRFGKVINPSTLSYIKTSEETRNNLNRNEKAVFDKLFPTKKNILGEDIKETNPNSRIEKSTLLRANKNVFDEVSQMYQKLQKDTGQSIDPVYTLPWEKAQNVLWARSLPPGESGETKQELLYGQPWYKDFKDQETAFYQALEKKLGKRDDPYNYPDESPQITALSEAYYKLPKGTGQRSDFLDANPSLLSYWGERDKATNRHRVALGLPPIEKEEFASSGSSGSSGGFRRSGGRARSAGSPYKYAISLSTGGRAPSVKVSLKDTKAPKSKAKKAVKPKVSIKKNLV